MDDINGGNNKMTEETKTEETKTVKSDEHTVFIGNKPFNRI